MWKGKSISNHALTGLVKAWKKIFTYRRFFIACNICLGIAAAIIPPALVVYQRWLNHPSFGYVLNFIWIYSPLKQLLLPSFFLIIFFLFPLSIYFFSLLAIYDKVKLPDPTTEPTHNKNASVDIPKRQKSTSTCLFIIGGICLAADIIVSIIHWTKPGIEMLVVPLLFILGLILKEIKLDQIKSYLIKHAGWVIAYTAVYSVVLVLLQSLFNEKEYQLGAEVILFFIVAVIMTRWYKSIPVILWVSLGALILYAWEINPWYFHLIGDELEFYNFAAYIAITPISKVCKEIFDVVVAHNTYLVCLFQAIFMKIFGVSNFGWRISNPVILSAAVVCFYLFFRKFTKQSTALIIAGMLACSSYLMNFGKIGYDNPQAFFMLGLTLWLAAEAVFSKRPVMYALLGLAMGFCLYSFPAALYILPLPVLMMALFDFPKSKSAFCRWAWCIGIVIILAFPLIFQPAYFQNKVNGLFINYPDSIAHYGVWFIFGTNLIYSLFSYIYVVGETHYIAASHIDPISALWVPAGIAWLIVQLRRNKFALFWILSFLIMWFLAGATHGREYPPNTRMFMLLPWWFSFAAFGITWLAEWIGRTTKSAIFEKAIPIMLMVIIAATNLVQVYWLVPQRFAGMASMESLFLRLANRGDHDPGNPKPTYLFVTDELWLIDRIQYEQDIYDTPRSAVQLDRTVMTDETPEPDQLVRLQAADTIVIPQPWMEPNRLIALTAIMLETDKVVCPIRETPDTNIIFTAYFPPKLAHLCPVDGNWEE
jgi:hypothetical protein